MEQPQSSPNSSSSDTPAPHQFSPGGQGKYMVSYLPIHHRLGVKGTGRGLSQPSSSKVIILHLFPFGNPGWFDPHSKSQTVWGKRVQLGTQIRHSSGKATLGRKPKSEIREAKQSASDSLLGSMKLGEFLLRGHKKEKKMVGS